jgi:hypothetical protein
VADDPSDGAGADRDDRRRVVVRVDAVELQRVVLIRSRFWKQEQVAEVMGIRPEQVAELLRVAGGASA